MKQRRTRSDSSNVVVVGGGVVDASGRSSPTAVSFARSMSGESHHSRGSSGPEYNDVYDGNDENAHQRRHRRRRPHDSPTSNTASLSRISNSSSTSPSISPSSSLSPTTTVTAARRRRRRQEGNSSATTVTMISPPLRIFLLFCPLSFFCSLILSSWVLSGLPSSSTPSGPHQSSSSNSNSHHAIPNSNADLKLQLQQQQQRRRNMREERKRLRNSAILDKDSSIKNGRGATTYSSFLFSSSWWWSSTWSLTASTTAAKEEQQQQPDEEEEDGFEEWIDIIDMRNLSYELPFRNSHHQSSSGAWTQGWELKPVPLPLAAVDNRSSTMNTDNDDSEDDVLQIFVVPHSHCDPGWIHTVDEYYNEKVVHILDTVVEALRRDDRRTFIWAEVVFLQKWWQQQNATQRALLTHLIHTTRQLELVTGSWVSPDEANTNFYSLQVQLQEGYDWLVETFGNHQSDTTNNDASSSSFLPQYAWSLDPFGYSPTLAYLLQSGPFKIRGLVIQRVHYAIKKHLAKHQHLEFYWRQTWDSNVNKHNSNNAERGNHYFNATRIRITLTNIHEGIMVDNQHQSERRTLEQEHVKIVDDDVNELQPHSYDLLTHILPFYSYDVPHSCGPDPSVCCQFDFARLPMQHKHGSTRRHHRTHQDNKRPCPWGISPVEITEQNVQERAMLLLDQYRKKASLHRSGKLVLAPLGDDFRFQTIDEAELQFQNYQKIITYIQDNVPSVHMQFGTLRDYFRAVERYQERLRQRQKQQQQKERQQPGGQLVETSLSSTRSKLATPILIGSFLSPPYADVDEAYWSGYYSSRMSDKAMIRRLERALYAAERMGATHQEMQYARRTLSLVQHHDAITGTAESFVVQDYANKIHAALQFTQNWMRDSILQTHFTNEKSNSTTGTEDPALFLKPCWQYMAPRGKWRNFCENLDPEEVSNNHRQALAVVVYNPLESEAQECGNVIVPPGEIRDAVLPCEIMPWWSTSWPQRPEQQQHKTSPLRIVFDKSTGLMTEPVREEWMVWSVSKGGAYLFYPAEQGLYDLAANNHQVLHGGYVVQTKKWNRTVLEKQVPTTKIGTTATVIDFVFETHLDEENREWFVRFSGNVSNGGVFHTDLNGFNFDTHRYRSDMPVQSQVHPMPNMASIEDNRTRMTILSEHAQGAASLQDGTIDIWLDRRLAQDDARGLGQGIQDNAPTQTRLRLILEECNGPPDGDESLPRGEFQPTKLVQGMWDQLQHPLQIFGNHTIDLSEFDEIADPIAFEKAVLERRARREEERRAMGNFDSDITGRAEPPIDGARSNRLPDHQGWSNLDGVLNYFASGDAQQPNQHPHKSHPDDYARSRLAQKFDGGFHGSGPLQFKPRSITSTRFNESNANVVFVYMVFKRVDYLKKAIESLTKSDYPRERLPLIISHDGHVPEVVQYVETLKKDYNIIQLFHPFSCYEHPESFPGDDKKLNDGYKGDRFGRPRSPWATCCKHHFTWMINQVFQLEFGPNLPVDTFLFMEEDYLVAPSVYQAIVAGSNILDSVGGEALGGFLGLGLDPTNADKKTEPFWLEDTWHADVFATGPMTLNRSVFAQLKAHARAYCTVDEYNWDWSLVHLGGMGYLPHTVLTPARVLAKHIGTIGGMHTDKSNVLEEIQQRYPEQREGDQERLEHSLRQRKAFDTLWAGKRVNGNLTVLPRKHAGYGGWGHPADQEHCLTLLNGE